MTAAPSSVRVRRAAVAVPDPAVSVAISRHLNRRGFDVVQTGSLDELLVALRRASGDGGFGMAMVDVALPAGAHGESIVNAIDGAPHTAIVLVAPGSQEPLARAALDRGAAAYLLRPFGLFELDAVVGRALARIELTELRRQRTVRPGMPPIIDYELLPAQWLHWGDERSAAGTGHGYRVARTAKAIAAALPEFDGEERWVLEFASRAHELGWLGGPVRGEIEMAVRAATMLAELGVDARVAQAVRHMFERWDGTGGPDGLAGTAIPLNALVLAAADRIDHTAAVEAGGRHAPELAIGTAIHTVLATQDAALGPHVITALQRARPAIESMWAITTAFPEH